MNLRFQQFLLGWTTPLVNEVIMRRTAVFLGAVLVVAAPIAGTALHASADWAARAEFAKLAHDLPGLAALRVTADPWRGKATVEGLTYRRAALVLRVGRISLPFAAPQSFFASAAFAQDSEDKDSDDVDKVGNAGGMTSGVGNTASVVAPSGPISAENVEIDVGALHYTIKKIELSGTNLTKADLDSILDPQSTVSIADRIGKFSASRIAIPEIAMLTASGNQTEKDSYGDVVLDDVADGRVGKTTIGSLTSNLTSPEAGAMQTTYGPIKIIGFDLPLAARIVSEARKSDSEPRTTLYESLEIASGKIILEKSNLEVDMGALSGKDVKARPMRVPPTTAAALFDSKDADSTRQVNAFIADALDSFEISKLEVADLRVTVTDADAPGTGTFGRIYLLGMDHSKIAELGVENFAVQAQDSSVTIGGFAFHDVDLGVLRTLAESSSGASASANHGTGTSIVSEVNLFGLDVDAAQAKTAAEGDRRTRFQLGKLDLVSADPIDGIPTHFSTAIDHFTLDLRDMAGSEFNDVAALGYGRVDLSSRFEAHFDAAKQELGVDDLSVSGIDMGAVKIVCSFANVSRDLFSTDQAQIEAAALSVLIRRIEIKVDNSGLFERLIATAAKSGNKSPDEIREAYVAGAALGIPALLGDGPAAKAVGAAIAKFIAAPRNLRIVAVAPEGLGAADFVLIKDPSALMSKLSVEAAADE
jgi:hypothetical protein